MTRTPIKLEELTPDNKGYVDARKIHLFLESGTKFTDWHSRKVQRGRFKADRDYFEFFSDLGKTTAGGRPESNFMYTVNMAKHVCMTEENEKGYQVRDYFIECEERLKTQQPTGDIDMLQLARMGIDELIRQRDEQRRQEAEQVRLKKEQKKLGDRTTQNEKDIEKLNGIRDKTDFSIQAVLQRNGAASLNYCLTKLPGWGKTRKHLVKPILIAMGHPFTIPLDYYDKYGQWCPPCDFPLVDNLDHTFSVFKESVKWTRTTQEKYFFTSRFMPLNDSTGENQEFAFTHSSVHFNLDMRSAWLSKIPASQRMKPKKDER